MTSHTNDDAQAAAIELRESRTRSLLKAISYRVIGTLTTAFLTYVITGDVGAALAIGAVEPFAKIVIFYLHERAWQLLPRGSVRKALKRSMTIARPHD
jgi:uncharacterized membrane protein